MTMPDLIRRNLHKTERLLSANSPAILTAIGVVGIVGTVVVTHRATLKADEILRQDDLTRVPGSEPHTLQEKARLTWKAYLPVVAVASLSVAAVVGAQYVNTKRMAALMAGYVALESKHEEYKDKVLELVGKKKAEAIDEALYQDMANSAQIGGVNIQAGDVPCIDILSGRPFSSNMESLRKAQNDINELILHGDQPSVSELYARLGLDTNKMSDAFGWNDENMCEMKFTTVLDEKGVPFLVMDFSVLPVGNFWKIAR